MSSTRIVAVLGVVVVFLSLMVAPVTPAMYAQAPNDDGRPRDESQPAVREEVDDSKQSEARTGDESSAQGLIDPTPAGFTMLYMFSGARHTIAAGAQVATVVHCTNYGSETAAVRVEVFDWNNDPDNTFSGQINVLPNRTRTFSTATTQVYDLDVLMTQPIAEAINQGSGRVLSDKDTVICTAQVIDPAHAWPYFAVKLALHYPNGTPVSAYYVASAHLPVILREASPEP